MRKQIPRVTISFRATAKEARLIEHYATKSGTNRAAWIQALVSQRLIELMTKQEAAS